MPTVSLDWTGGWSFDGYDSKRMPVDIDGTQHQGARPSDLLPLALAACSATDLVNLLDGGTGSLTGLSVEATFTKSPDPPWAFQVIRLHYRVTGIDLTDDQVAAAIRRSHEELCSVAAAIRTNVAIESSHEVVTG